MIPLIEAVVPVRMPSDYLLVFEDILFNLPTLFRVNFVLDFENLESIENGWGQREVHNAIYYKGSFGSPGGARNAALANLKGRYVTFWDVDDFPNVENVLELVKLMEAQEVDLGIGNWAYTDRPLDPRGVLPREVGNNPGIWRFIFRREFIAENQFSNMKWGEDQLFLTQLFARKPRIVFSDLIVYKYSKHSENSLTSNTDNAKDLFEVASKGIPYLGLINCEQRKSFSLMYIKQVGSLLKHRRYTLARKVFVMLFVLNPARLGVLKDLLKLYMGDNKW
jgi:glycosyltransferase involved in cell wall biosynthesis